MLKIKHITAAYHEGNNILSDINIELGDGERLAILGRNGAGKTTFANCIFGLVPFIQGKILFNQKNILESALYGIASSGIGYFMQGAPVFPQMSVRENLQVSARMRNKKDFEYRYTELAQSFTLLKDREVVKLPAGSMSGGERTQLALAMAVFSKPSLLILDEPFAGLSPGNANHVLQILNEYQDTTKASVIMIAQEKQHATAFCDTHYVIRDGNIILF